MIVDRPLPHWERLPPGDAMLTRRVKQLGPTYTEFEQRGRKKFSKGVWAPPENIARARVEVQYERADPRYQRKRELDASRRAEQHSEYVEDFREAVIAFLRFAPAFRAHESMLADAITEHATPVGSGTVARTKRIPIEERAEAAVIAWLRHQTTAYDQLEIARVKGLRREVRRELASISRQLLDLHRVDRTHSQSACPLCQVVGP